MYDKVYNRETYPAIIIQDGRKHYTSSIVTGYDCAEAIVQKVEAEVHTSHSFDITEYSSNGRRIEEVNIKPSVAAAHEEMLQRLHRTRELLVQMLQETDASILTIHKIGVNKI